MANELKRYKSFFQVYKREFLRQIPEQVTKTLYRINLPDKEGRGEGVTYYLTIACDWANLKYREQEGAVYLGIPYDKFELTEVEPSPETRESKALAKRLLKANDMKYDSWDQNPGRLNPFKDFAVIAVWDFSKNWMNMFLGYGESEGIDMESDKFLLGELKTYRSLRGDDPETITKEMMAERVLASLDGENWSAGTGKE